MERDGEFARPVFGTPGEAGDHEKPGEQASGVRREGDNTPTLELLPLGLESSPMLVGVRGETATSLVPTLCNC